MRASLLKDTIKSLFPQRRTIAIEGSPGGGKTTLVHEVAQSLGVGFIEVHMPTMLVEDFGVPNMASKSETFDYKLPDWFPAESRTDIPDSGILLFDDRNQADADLQKGFANICQARKLHGVPLKKGWQAISTGNRQSDRAGGNRVLSHLRNRETVYEFETHLDDWRGWALDHGVKSEVVAFIGFRPNLLHDFDPKRDQNPTPRAWVEGVSAVLGVVPQEAEYESFCGAVGEGAAAEFSGFIKIYRKLPNPDAVLMHPDTADVPTDPATKYALSGAIAERASDSNMERVCRYAERMGGDFSVLTISHAVRKHPELATTQAFNDWAVKHSDVLF